MPHNVYTGDEEGKVVRSIFFHLEAWFRRKEGFVNQVEWKAGRNTQAV
jgi:hypothetical protein